MIRIVIFSVCLGFSFVSTLIIIIASFSTDWWISKNGNVQAGLQKYCNLDDCWNYDIKFRQLTFSNSTNHVKKEIVRSSKSLLKRLKTFMLISSILITLSLIGIIAFVYILCRSHNARIATWFHLPVLFAASSGGLLGLLAVYYAAKPPAILHGKLLYGYAWFFVLVGSSASIVISISLLATFYCVNVCPSRRQSNRDSTDNNLRQSTSNDNIHPYMQYYADEQQSRGFDNDILEGSYSMAQLDTFSNEPYSDLAFEIPMNNNHLTSSYTNLTHRSNEEQRT